MQEVTEMEVTNRFLSAVFWTILAFASLLLYPTTTVIYDNFIT